MALQPCSSQVALMKWLLLQPPLTWLPQLLPLLLSWPHPPHRLLSPLPLQLLPSLRPARGDLTGAALPQLKNLWCALCAAVSFLVQPPWSCTNGCTQGRDLTPAPTVERALPSPTTCGSTSSSTLGRGVIDVHCVERVSSRPAI